MWIEKKRREQTHTAYMQIVNTKTERVLGARGHRTTMESVILGGREGEREGGGVRVRKTQNYRRGEERTGGEGKGGEAMQPSTNERNLSVF